MIEIYFSVPIPHPKGGNIVFTCVNDNIIDEKEKYEAIGLRGFDYKLFEEEEGGGTREGLYGYPCFKHLIQLWTGDWEKQMEKMNEAIGMKNRVTVGGGGKRIVRLFRRQEFRKCIGCVLSAITYGKKRHKIWSELPKYSRKMAPTKLRRDVRGNTNLYKVCCDIYRTFYIYACHGIFLSYTTSFIYGFSL